MGRGRFASPALFSRKLAGEGSFGMIVEIWHAADIDWGTVALRG